MALVKFQQCVLCWEMFVSTRQITVSSISHPLKTGRVWSRVEIWIFRPNPSGSWKITGVFTRLASNSARQIVGVRCNLRTIITPFLRGTIWHPSLKTRFRPTGPLWTDVNQSEASFIGRVGCRLIFTVVKRFLFLFSCSGGSFLDRRSFLGLRDI